MKIGNATKKPVIIQHSPGLSEENREEVGLWIIENGGDFHEAREPDGKGEWHHTGIMIKTLEGWLRASFGDIIIRGIDGEFYPCKPDIFERSYDMEDETQVEEERPGCASTAKAREVWPPATLETKDGQ